MRRFVLFVDGSNLFGSLKAMNLEVQDYEAFFGYLYDESRRELFGLLRTSNTEPYAFQRTYWYTVGSIDDWDLSLPQSQDALREAFMKDKEIRDSWMGIAGREHPKLGGPKLRDKAWEACFNDFKEWYEGKRRILEGMQRFHQSVKIHTDGIDIIASGHWKVNFLRKWVEEKGLDTALAVDMLALSDNYDVAIVLSGDADMIPSINHAKTRNKHVVALEFVNGSPPERKGRSFSSRLKEHADLAVRIYESELLRHNLAKRPTRGTA